MAHCSLGPLPALAALQHHEGLGAAPAYFRKASGLRDRFKVHPHCSRVRILKKRRKDIALVHVYLVSYAAYLADAHDAMAHDINQEAGREHTALYNERNIAGCEPCLEIRWVHEGKDMPVDCIHQPHAVRAPDTDACLFPDPDKLFLEPAPF